MKRNNQEPAWVQPVPTLDLTKFCRDSKKIDTTIRIKWDWDQAHDFTWLKLGQINLTEGESNHRRGLWDLTSYLRNCTDFEHSSAQILRMELIGVHLDPLGIYSGKTRLYGWINPNQDGYFDRFGVPTEGYDPLKTAKPCDVCKGDDKHLMVAEGHYIPPNNPDLYKLIRGKKVEITTGMRFK